MVTNQTGQQLLLQAREPGQIRIGQQIRAMLMMPGMCDIETDLVQARRPLQQLRVLRIRQTPAIGNSFEQCPRRLLDALGLLDIDMKA